MPCPARTSRRVSLGCHSEQREAVIPALSLLNKSSEEIKRARGRHGSQNSEVGWGCHGFLHALLPADLKVHGNPSGDPENCSRACQSQELCHSCENMTSSEIRGAVLHLGFVAEEESGVKRKRILLLCSVPEVSSPSKGIGNTWNVVLSAFSQMEQNYHSAISVAVPGINRLSHWFSNTKAVENSQLYIEGIVPVFIVAMEQLK